MADIIQLLPDSIANQIAAGEVIQRPASAVKELLENAIDAGASSIKLILKDAGKALIQVIDDGCGMSETDARMSFERHATSKIRHADDLFNIRTMGFRGEALASIASIAQVELKTRRNPDELGTKIIIEGFELKSQEPCQTPAGTSFSIKNLFFNVPARRNFLKSNTVEFRHIMDEFERVALANPSVFFSLHHNGQEVFHLPAGNLRQRIVGVFGKDTNKKLVPVGEDTEAVRLSGFVGKPEFAKKTRGEQFFFVNNRFIKSQYLNHAVQAAFEDLMPRDGFPMYFIFIEIDPARIDINVHPTKQEIKFDDERLIYNYLKVAVRHALGQNAVTPMLDFEVEPGMVNNYTVPKSVVNRIDYNFDKNTSSQESQETANRYPSVSTSKTGQFEKMKNDLNFKKPTSLERSNLDNWQKLYEGLSLVETDGDNKTDGEPAINEEGIPADFDFSQYFQSPIKNLDSQSFPEEFLNEAGKNDYGDSEGEILTFESKFESERKVPELGDSFDENNSDSLEKSTVFSKQQREPYQIHNSFVVSHIKSGFLLIDQQAAAERILYERYLAQLGNQDTATQTQLFPKTVNFSPSDAALLKDMLSAINQLGFDVQDFGNGAFIVHGLPSDWQGSRDEQKILENLLEQYKNEVDVSLNNAERIAASMARSAATRRGTPLSIREMMALIDQLFACAMPFKSPNGRNCFISYSIEDLTKLFLA
ncbi:MAG: DNA mismatch repair endonuclease MutL [Saprospiraceae bacterium]|nr:DNA mismatch repair endonuclease MutL [Saprospiraceae bacterium]